MEFLTQLPVGTFLILCTALLITFGFEFVNGFHDTANAVATVIYTHSLPPTVAVCWSGLMNFLGVMVGGVTVAYSIVHLLPIDLLANIGSREGMAMLFSLVISAVLWNLSTWYLGLPISSTHALIGSILGVGLIHGLVRHLPFDQLINWNQTGKVILSLLLSPLIGFLGAAGLLLTLKRTIKTPKLYQPADQKQPPPWWIRGILFLTCTGVSFGHGSNDGQKGMGLIVLVLIGIVPVYFTLNLDDDRGQIAKTRAALGHFDQFLVQHGQEHHPIRKSLAQAAGEIDNCHSYRNLSENQRKTLRIDLLHIQAAADELLRNDFAQLPDQERSQFENLTHTIEKPTEYVPTWVVIGVGLSLGLGTMVGWKRVVVTVGEKIGKAHLSYAEGASAEFVAALTIGLGDFAGLPVSTTHVLSSGVAGTMAANGSGLEMRTIKRLAAAWVLTLPGTMLMSALMFSASRSIIA